MGVVAERAGVVSMTMHQCKVSYFLKVILILAVSSSCKSDLSDDPIPIVPFPDFVANLISPEYQSLTVNGGYTEIGSIGVRGVILYRSSATSYLAFERNCSYRPNEACATVNVDASKLFMVDPCCNSSFSFVDGAPTGGVASGRLRIYKSTLNGTLLTITNEIVN